MEKNKKGKSQLGNNTRESKNGRKNDRINKQIINLEGG